MLRLILTLKLNLRFEVYTSDIPLVKKSNLESQFNLWIHRAYNDFNSLWISYVLGKLFYLKQNNENNWFFCNWQFVVVYFQ